MLVERATLSKFDVFRFPGTKVACIYLGDRKYAALAKPQYTSHDLDIDFLADRVEFVSNIGHLYKEFA
jgi:hypothetical protein